MLMAVAKGIDSFIDTGNYCMLVGVPMEVALSLV
jgi:hypothetical protein